MATDHTCLHTIEATDGTSQRILCHVERDGSNFKLLATEGDSSFGASLNLLKQIQPDGYRGNLSEWRDALCVLLCPPELNAKPGLLSLTASVSPLKITIHVCQRVAGILDHLISFDLQAGEEEIPLFEWALGAAARRSLYQGEYSVLSNRLEEQVASFESLKTQLQSLVDSKTTHDEVMLLKFQDLVNSKKREIRQLRLDDKGVEFRHDERIFQVEPSGDISRDSSPLTGELSAHTVPQGRESREESLEDRSLKESSDEEL